MVGLASALPISRGLQATGPGLAAPLHHHHVTNSEEQGLRENFTLTDTRGLARTIRVHLPVDYYVRGNRQNYPLLLMQDGQNLFENETAFMGKSWKLGAALMDGQQSGRLRDVIAVGIDNTWDHETRMYEYGPWYFADAGHGGGADDYLDWIKSTVLPELERRYRLAPERENRVIGGASMGALLSLYAMVRNPELFGGAILMSGSYQWANAAGNFVDWIKSRWQGVPQGMKLWMTVGTGEKNRRLYEPNHQMKDFFRGQESSETGEFNFSELDGGHDEISWRRQIPLALEHFFAK